MAYYRAAQSPSTALNVTAGDVTYDTVLSLELMRGDEVLAHNSVVRPGDAITAVSTLTVSTGAPIASASISLDITLPTIGKTTLTGVTDTSGMAVIDLTAWLSSSPVGGCVFQSRFAGVMPTGGVAGFYATETLLYDGGSSYQLEVY